MFGKKKSAQEPREFRRKAVDFERELVDYARAACAGRKNASVVVANISGSGSCNYENYVYAINMFRSLVGRFEGRLFILKSRDLVFAYQGAIGEPAIREAVSNIRLLFEIPGVPRRGDFAAWYDLERDDEALLAYAEAQWRARAEREGAVETAEDTDPTAGTFGRFARFMSAFEAAELAPLLRRQPLCRIGGDGVPAPLRHEVYVSIPDLERSVPGAAGLGSDRHLFHYVARALDRRVLGAARGELERLPAGISLNLNMATVSSPDWSEWACALDAGERSRIAVEIAYSDAMSDIGMFLAVQRKLSGLGMTLVLDGLPAEMLAFINLDVMRVDLVKVVWDAELADAGSAAGLIETVARCGADRFALCRCDGPEAVRFGRALGIGLFQGRHIDRLLAGEPEPAARRTVSPPRRPIGSAGTPLVCL